MELKKVFDCTDMPDKVRNAFYARASERGAGNDCYVDWDVNDSGYGDEEDAQILLIDDWLIENGALVAEQVIIKHWW